MREQNELFQRRQFWPRPGRPEALGEIEFDQPCPNCSYNLRGLPPGSPCPECGSIGGLAISDEPLPWEERRSALSFVHTVIRVIFCPHDVARQIWRPARLDVVAAARFRRICLLIACTALLAILLTITSAVIGARRAVWCMPFDIAAVVVWMNAATLEPLRFFRNYLSSHTLNRAEVILRYAAAPLVLVPLQLAVLPVTLRTAQAPQGWLIAAGAHVGLLFAMMSLALLLHGWLMYETVNVPKVAAFMYPMGAALSSAATGVVMLIAVPAFAASVLSRIGGG